MFSWFLFSFCVALFCVALFILKKYYFPIVFSNWSWTWTIFFLRHENCQSILVAFCSNWKKWKPPKKSTFIETSLWNPNNLHPLSVYTKFLSNRFCVVNVFLFWFLSLLIYISLCTLWWNTNNDNNNNQIKSNRSMSLLNTAASIQLPSIFVLKTMFINMHIR